MKIYDKLYILRTKVPTFILHDIDDWDVEKGLAMAKEDGHSYGFRFQRRGLEESRVDGHYNVKSVIIKESGTYYFGGYIETVEDIKARIELNHHSNDKDKVLLRILEVSGSRTLVRSIQTDSWSCVFHEGVDVLLEDK